MFSLIRSLLFVLLFCSAAYANVYVIDYQDDKFVSIQKLDIAYKRLATIHDVPTLAKEKPIAHIIADDMVYVRGEIKCESEVDLYRRVMIDILKQATFETQVSVYASETTKEIQQ
jgi:hypothetical protein